MHTRSANRRNSDVIAGALDTQVPIGDFDLLMHSGDTPKEAWVHPRGGHMGRDAAAWPDRVIFRHGFSGCWRRQAKSSAKTTR